MGRCTRRRVFNNGVHKLVHATPSFPVFRRSIREFTSCTFEQNQSQAPNIALVPIQISADSLWLQKHDNTGNSYKPFLTLESEYAGKLSVKK